MGEVGVAVLAITRYSLSAFLRSWRTCPGQGTLQRRSIESVRNLLSGIIAIGARFLTFEPLPGAKMFLWRDRNPAGIPAAFNAKS